MADAEEFLEEAKILYQHDKFRGILNRCYYSYFWLIKGLLHEKGQHIKTHQGVETKFFEFYIKNEMPIVQLLSILIYKKDEKLKNASLAKDAQAIKISIKKLIAYKRKDAQIAACFNAGYSMGGRIIVCLINGKKWGEKYVRYESDKLN